MRSETPIEGSTGRARILLVGAGMGAGHAEVAGELARRLSDRGADTRAVDLLDIAGRAGQRLQRTYRLLLARAPWLYDGAMRFWARRPGPLQRLTAAGAGPFEEALLHQARSFEPDLIVATFNLAGQCLGRLRRRGALSTPLATVVIDPGPHPYWVSPGVGRHLVPAVAVEAYRGYGAPGAEAVAPALRPEFRTPPEPTAARARLGLPGDRPIALVNAGSWAAGNLASTVDTLRRSPDLHVVVLCGRDAALLRRWSGSDRVRAVPWTREIVAYLSAADVIVDNAGGLTCWESLALRKPVVIFDPLPGHGRLNAAALQRAGLALWVRERAGLAAAVRSAVERVPATEAVFSAPDPARRILQLLPEAESETYV